MNVEILSLNSDTQVTSYIKAQWSTLNTERKTDVDALLKCFRVKTFEA
jgi:hypothetical protein